jgi:hypothetical protein
MLQQEIEFLLHTMKPDLKKVVVIEENTNEDEKEDSSPMHSCHNSHDDQDEHDKAQIDNSENESGTMTEESKIEKASPPKSRNSTLRTSKTMIIV